MIWNSNDYKHGDEIGVGGQILKLSSIGIELHVESSLPLEWKQCLDLQFLVKIRTMLCYIDVIVTKIGMYLNLKCD